MESTTLGTPTPKFGKLMLEVMSCTPTEGYNESGAGYILKLQHKEVKELKTPFGLKSQNVQQTFYMKVAEECKVGFSAVMDIDTMRVVERPFTPEDAAVDDEPLMLKWLHLQ